MAMLAPPPSHANLEGSSDERDQGERAPPLTLRDSQQAALKAGGNAATTGSSGEDRDLSGEWCHVTPRARSTVKHGIATDLHPLLTAHRKSLACWAFGHTHVSCNKLICGVRVVSNQHGYPQPHEGEPDTFYNRRFTISFKIKNATE